MADYEKLKSDIASVIKNNGAGEITGAALQEQMLNIVDTLNEGKAEASKLTELESEVLNLIGPDSIRSGFYDKGLIYREAEPFCCAKIDISKTSVIRIKSYVYGNAAITLTDEANSILYQITDNYSINPFLINVKDYVGAKWLYLSNTTSYVPSNEVIAEAVKLNESVSVSIANLGNELIKNNEAISNLSESFESMAENLTSTEQTIEGIVGGTKTIDTSNGLAFQRKSYLDANGNIAAAGSEAWYISEYYSIENISRIELYANANWGFSVCAICDNNKNVLSTLTGIGEKKLYEINDFPEGAKYVIFHSKEDDSYANFYIPSKINEKSLKDSNVLVIGDSISTGTSSAKRNSNWMSYGGYDKWVDKLIATKFFSDEKTYNCSWHATGFVADQNGAYDSFVKRLKAIEEPSKYNYVIVFGGINDWIKSVAMDAFKAKVDEFFDYLINNFTTARVLVLTPLQCYNYEVASRYEKNNAGLYQKDYSDYIEEVCEKYALPILDLRRHSGFCPINETFRNRWTLITSNPDGGYWPADGTHPTKEYEDDYLAPMIKNFIEKFVA